MKKVLAVALIAGMFMPILGGAQEKKGKTPEEQFKALDANNDNKLTKDEFLARIPDDKKDKRGQIFGRWDKNSDGTLSLEEYKEGAAAQKKKK